MITQEQRREGINKISRLPDQLRELVQNLSAEQLTTPYLAGEWTVAQNVHHVADSHMNSYIRVKLILTEAHPTLKPYDQDAWAELADADGSNLETSLLILEGLHRRWVALFESLAEAQWHRAGLHPENGEMTVADFVEVYAAHGEAHLDQIRRTLAAQPMA